MLSSSLVCRFLHLWLVFIPRSETINKQPNDQAHPPPAQPRPTLSRAGEPENAETAGGRVQRLVVLLLIGFSHPNPNAAPEQPSRAPPKSRRRQTAPNAATFQRPEYCLLHASSRRSDTTLSSPAARQLRPTLSRARKLEKRQHCGRAGAAPGCVAVLFLSPPATQTLHQSKQATPADRADATNFDFTRPNISGQSTACFHASK
jgi:hypothetical protein